MYLLKYDIIKVVKRRLMSSNAPLPIPLVKKTHKRSPLGLFKRIWKDVKIEDFRNRVESCYLLEGIFPLVDF